MTAGESSPLPAQSRLPSSFVFTGAGHLLTSGLEKENSSLPLPPDGPERPPVSTLGVLWELSVRDWAAGWGTPTGSLSTRVLCSPANRSILCVGEVLTEAHAPTVQWSGSHVWLGRWCRQALYPSMPMVKKNESDLRVWMRKDILDTLISKKMTVVN